jgi:dihydrofolate reductase
MVKLIVAIASNRVIGKDNDLIWHLPADMRFFTQTTKGHIVIMGRRNWDSIPLKYRPLSDRINVVITRNKNFRHPDCVVFNSLEESIIHYKKNAEKNIFIIGGGQIYKEAIDKDLVDEMLITHIDHAFEGDTWFPEINENTWKRELVMTHPNDEKNAYSFSVWKYNKKSA